MNQSECPPLCLTAMGVSVIGLFAVGPSVQTVVLFVVGMLAVYAGHVGRVGRRALPVSVRSRAK